MWSRTVVVPICHHVCGLPSFFWIGSDLKIVGRDFRGQLMAISWVMRSVCYFRARRVGVVAGVGVGATGLKVTSFPVRRKPCDSFTALSLRLLWTLTSVLTPEWKPAALLVERGDDTTEEEWCQFSHGLAPWGKSKLVLMFVLLTQNDPQQRRL